MSLNLLQFSCYLLSFGFVYMTRSFPQNDYEFDLGEFPYGIRGFPDIIIHPQIMVYLELPLCLTRRKAREKVIAGCAPE